MDHAARPPMLAAAALSAALHAAALALVLASLDLPMEEPRSLSVEVSWEQGADGAAAAEQRSGPEKSAASREDNVAPPTASPAGLTRGSILGSSPRTPAEPWIAGSSPGDDAEQNQADIRAEEPPSPAVAQATPAEDARGEIKVGADLRSAPTRSRGSGQRLASAQPSSPAFLTLSADLTLRQAQDEVGSRRARKREKEPEPQRSEPSPACGPSTRGPHPELVEGWGPRAQGEGGQGEGGAACAVASESGATPQRSTQPTDDTSRNASGVSAADRSDAANAATAAVGSPAPGGAAPAADGDIVSRVPPTYPLTARRQGLQGTAIVRARVDAEGRPETVAVVASSGSTSLDDAAREAVRRWRFRAGAAGVLDMPITFRLSAAVGG